MGAQDSIEKVLREIHVLFSKAEPYNGSKKNVVVDKNAMMDLLKELNSSMYEMMEEHELTVQSREKANRQHQKQGDDIIFDARKNPRLIQIISNLREQFYRYRLEYVKDTDYHIVLLNEHKELVNAIESGKKEEARKIMKKHITNQEMTVIRNIKEEY